MTQDTRYYVFCEKDLCREGFVTYRDTCSVLNFIISDLSSESLASIEAHLFEEKHMNTLSGIYVVYTHPFKGTYLGGQPYKNFKTFDQAKMHWVAVAYERNLPVYTKQIIHLAAILLTLMLLIYSIITFFRKYIFQKYNKDIRRIAASEEKKVIIIPSMKTIVLSLPIIIILIFFSALGFAIVVHIIQT